MARRNKGEERDIGVRRIDTLLALARKESRTGRGDLADRYAHLSLAIAQKYQTGLERRHKGQLCRGCGAFLLPGRTSRTRIHAGRIAMTCLRCGHVRRIPLHGRAPASVRREGKAAPAGPRPGARSVSRGGPPSPAR